MERIDVAVVGYITRDTIIIAGENERSEYHSCGGVSSYFSLVTSALGYNTGIVTPIGNDFSQDYITDNIKQTYKLNQDKVDNIHAFVDKHPGNAEFIESALAEYLASPAIGLPNADSKELAKELSQNAIYNPIKSADNINLDGSRVKGDYNSEINVLVPNSGYTVGIIRSKLPEITSSDVPDSYLQAKGVHIGALFGEVTLDAVKYIRENSDAIITLDAQGFIRELHSFSTLTQEDLDNIRAAGASQEEILDWQNNNSDLVKLNKWEEMVDYGRYVDMMKMNEFEACVNAGVDTGDVDVGDLVLDEKMPYVEEAMDNLEAELTPVNEDIILLITMGGDGSYISFTENGERQRQHIPVLPSKVVDTTGAGDTNAAGFLTEYAQTGNVMHSAKFANAASSLQVETQGPYGFPDRDAVLKRMKGYDDE